MATETIPESDVYDERQVRESGLDENVASAVAYVLGFITGALMFVTDDRPAVRFHAAQSMVLSAAFVGVFLVFSVLNTILFATLFTGSFFVWGALGALFALIWGLVGLAGFVLWVYLLYSAYVGKRVSLPVVGPIAENIASK